MRSVRPGLEVLEDRSCPSTITWLGVNSGSVTDGDNWSGGTAPGVGDVALFSGQTPNNCHDPYIWQDTTITWGGLSVSSNYNGKLFDFKVVAGSNGTTVFNVGGLSVDGGTHDFIMEANSQFNVLGDGSISQNATLRIDGAGATSLVAVSGYNTDMLVVASSVFELKEVGLDVTGGANLYVFGYNQVYEEAGATLVLDDTQVHVEGSDTELTLEEGASVQVAGGDCLIDVSGGGNITVLADSSMTAAHALSEAPITVREQDSALKIRNGAKLDVNAELPDGWDGVVQVVAAALVFGDGSLEGGEELEVRTGSSPAGIYVADEGGIVGMSPDYIIRCSELVLTGGASWDVSQPSQHFGEYYANVEVYGDVIVEEGSGIRLRTDVGVGSSDLIDVDGDVSSDDSALIEVYGEGSPQPMSGPLLADLIMADSISGEWTDLFTGEFGEDGLLYAELDLRQVGGTWYLAAEWEWE